MPQCRRRESNKIGAWSTNSRPEDDGVEFEEGIASFDAGKFERLVSALVLITTPTEDD